MAVLAAGGTFAFWKTKNAGDEKHLSLLAGEVVCAQVEGDEANYRKVVTKYNELAKKLKKQELQTKLAMLPTDTRDAMSSICGVKIVKVANTTKK